jgi:hypothetical protein
MNKRLFIRNGQVVFITIVTLISDLTNEVETEINAFND